MCGIAGYYNLDGNHPPSRDLMIAWALLSARGTDASGALWRHFGQDHIWTYKSQHRSYDVASRIWDKIETPSLQWAAFHTRASTKGSPAVPANNHPVRYRNIYVTHNGIISNDTEVFKKLGTKRVADVDTEAIAACLAVGGIAKVVELCEGSMSIAWTDTKDLSALHLYTNGRSPLWAGSGKGWFSYASASCYLPQSLLGTEFKVDPGDHVTLRVGEPPLVEKVGIKEVRVWAPAWRGYSSGVYLCYDPECKDAGGHTHPKPRYAFRTHGLHSKSGFGGEK